MRVAVTGATGYLGWFVVTSLLADGHSVVILARDLAANKRFSGPVDTVAGSLDPQGDFRELLTGIDALVHGAFAHVAGRYRGGEGDDLSGFIRANVGGSLALLDQARSMGVKRCVVVSSRAVYGTRHPGVPLNEDLNPVPDTHYGAAKLALEGFVSAFARQEKWPVCAIRPTGIYGVTWPVKRSKWLDLVGELMAGKAIESGGGTEVHGTDVAGAILQLLEAPADHIAGRCFNCSDLYVSTRDIANIVAEITASAVRLPEDADRAGFNSMTCSGLSKLGVTFGGDALLRDTLAELVEIADSMR